MSTPTTSFTLESGKTYIIDQILTLTENLYIPENVTLIFQGGMFVSDTEVTIIGNHTSLAAPIENIFGVSINVIGTWNIDRAYPQWFASKSFMFSGRTTPDIADSIQKAINMKGTGEVFLLPANYYITHPLFIPVGIELKGTTSQIYGETNGNTYQATQIFPASYDGDYNVGIFPYEYLVYINSDYNDNQQFEFPNPWIAVQGITFIDYPKIHESGKCIYAGWGITVNQVKWYDFIQAIHCDNRHYSDGKSITNCVFHVHEEDGSRYYSDLYAFDLRGLGDALIFQNNHIGGSKSGYNMLCLHECGGGIINDNIINGDVRISASKGVTFSNNHMEYGAQIILDMSTVSLNDNYIEKGERPSIIVQTTNGDNHDIFSQCVVSMANNAFIYFNRNRYDYESDLSIKDARLSSISETDILISRTSILNINNNYRYDMVTVFGTINPIGIKIDTIEDNPDYRFNDYSYFMSQSGSISRNEQLRATVSYNNLNAPFLYGLVASEWVEWFSFSDKYMYYYAIVWDKNRDIYKLNNSKKFLPLNSTPIKLVKYGQGIQICIGIESDNGDAEGVNQGMNFNIELIRCRVDSTDSPIPGSYQHVVIPLCGSRIIYDNGISVCGYKWNNMMVDNLNEAVDNPKYETYTFNSGHVTASADKRVQLPHSGWQKGDLITNIGEDTSWTLEIIK